MLDMNEARLLSLEAECQRLVHQLAEAKITLADATHKHPLQAKLRDTEIRLMDLERDLYRRDRKDSLTNKRLTQLRYQRNLLLLGFILTVLIFAIL